MRNFVSIITVNYNGKHYLKNFLESALKQDYPGTNYEILVVDNGSSDGSTDYIKKEFPTVKIVESEINLGFGRGNNLGMKSSKGNLFLLVNNDTILARNTVNSFVKRFVASKGKIGAICAKLVLVDFYLPLLIEEAFFLDYSTPKVAEGYNSEPFIISHHSGNLFTEKVFIPINHTFHQGVRLHLTIKPFRRNDFRIFLGKNVVYEEHLKSLNESFSINLDISYEKLVKYRENLIQNAGNFFFRDGFGRDRGALVAVNKQFYEEDDGRYNKIEQVPGFCGAGVLLNKKAVEEVDYFDKDFFMYYEDSDLSFRLRERGWKIIYNPLSVIRHIHAGSSKEWSDFFILNAERGRLLFVSKHWPRFKALQLLIKYIIWDILGFFIYSFISKNWGRIKKRVFLRLKVLTSIFPGFFIGLFRARRLKYSDLKNFL